MIYRVVRTNVPALPNETIRRLTGQAATTFATSHREQGSGGPAVREVLRRSEPMGARIDVCTTASQIDSIRILLQAHRSIAMPGATPTTRGSSENDRF